MILNTTQVWEEEKMGLVDKFKSFVGADDTYDDEMMDGDLFEDEDTS